jgi:predicted outer membrane repeat protein
MPFGFFNSRSHRAPKSTPRGRRPGRRSCRLRLECLEDRTVPSTFAVNTTLDVVNATDGKLSLREAVTAANAHAGADTIVLPAGVFKIAIAGAGDDTNLSGDFDITDSVTIRGAGAGLTIIDGQHLDRVFDAIGTAPGSIKVVFQSLTVRGGFSDEGGGIRVGNANLVVQDCVVAGNTASVNGGGLSNASAPGTGNVTLVRTTVGRNVAGGAGGGLCVEGQGSTLTVSASRVRRNIAGGSGGGILATTATLTNSTVSGNSATGGNGGGISADTATLTNSTVSGNSGGAGGAGGGIYADTATLTNSTVSGNSASGAGGAGGGIFASDTATLTGSTVSGNSAGSYGGGIYADTATLTGSTVSGNITLTNGGGGIFASTATLTNSTVSGNTAVTEGGGIWAYAGALLNCTIAENIAANGGGVFHDPATGQALTVRNTIIALNLVTFGGTGPDVLGAFTSQGHNLIGDGTGGTGFTNGINFDIVGTSANPIDPKLGALANNGGRTMSMALLAGSPAIDHGDNSGVPATDQRGFGLLRRKDGNGDGVAVVDIGAFER